MRILHAIIVIIIFVVVFGCAVATGIYLIRSGFTIGGSILILMGLGLPIWIFCFGQEEEEDYYR